MCFLTHHTKTNSVLIHTHNKPFIQPIMTRRNPDDLNNLC